MNSVPMNDGAPLIVGLGGTIRPNSSTESTLKLALESAEQAGCRTRMFDGAFLASLPHYAAGVTALTDNEREFVDSVRRAEGLIIASPGYHGTVSGLVKNAIDLIEETSKDQQRVYLDNVPVGLIVTAYGWQATGSTLATLRAIVHSLRGWPTPMGVAINASGGVFNSDGTYKDPRLADQLSLVGRQVAEFVRWRRNGLSLGQAPAGQVG